MSDNLLRFFDFDFCLYTNNTSKNKQIDLFWLGFFLVRVFDRCMPIHFSRCLSIAEKWTFFLSQNSFNFDLIKRIMKKSEYVTSVIWQKQEKRV